MEYFLISLGFDHAISNECSKLWVLWRGDFECSVTVNSDQLISLSCKYPEISGCFNISVVYAKCSKVDRRILRTQMRSIASISNCWLIGGDFYIVRRQEERLGGRDVDFTAVNEFNDCISDSGLLEFAFSGSKFTWKKSNQRMWQRLDRYLCNSDWLSLCYDIQAVHLNRENSDHAPLLGLFKLSSASGQGCFRFQHMWVKHKEFKQMVKENWDQQIDGSPIIRFAAKLSRLRKRLKIWNKENFGNIFSNVLDAENRVKELEIQMEGSDDIQLLTDFKEAQDRLSNLLACEEGLWKQRSKIKWHKEGDKNTRFFHMMATSKRKKNKIHKIMNSEGDWLDNQQDIARVGVKFYSDQFNDSNTCLEFSFGGIHYSFSYHE